MEREGYTEAGDHSGDRVLSEELSWTLRERNSSVLKEPLKQEFECHLEIVCENIINTEEIRGQEWRKRGRNLMMKMEHLCLNLYLHLCYLYHHINISICMSMSVSM